MLNIQSLTKTFGQTTAVSSASFRVGLGELVCLLGPSGCGKSTLLRMVAGLTPSDSGRIDIDGRDVTTQAANRRPTAMVFQSHALWNHMSVAQNVGFGLRVRRLPNAVIAEKVAAALSLVGLDGFAKRRPIELSGGQAQRVALARCLVVEPKVLLMDEPFSALDAHLRKNLREELKLLQRRMQLTTIFVTHDQEEAMELADRIVVMSDGRLEQIGPPGELYLRPQTRTVANFIGSMNACETRIDNGRANWFGVNIAVARGDGSAAILCRPEDLKLDAAGAPGMVSRIIDLGPMLRVTVTTPAGAALVWLCARTAVPAVGDPVRLAPTRLHVYRDGILLEASAPPAPLALPQLASVAR
jgi:putative spermidine/putrescine transport system ATP-binding protein